MKNSRLACTIVAMALIAAGFAISSFADDTIDLLTSAPWKISGLNWSNVRIFYKDGTFSSESNPDEHGNWQITAGVVELTFKDGHKDTLKLPLNSNGTAGTDSHGNDTTAVIKKPAGINEAPVPAKYRILEINALSITISIGKGGNNHQTFKITKATKINFDGQPAKTDDLLVGMLAGVRPSDSDDNVAAFIDAKDASK